MAEVRELRWSMGLGIQAGKALLRAENALHRVQATGAYNDWDTVSALREARCELNHLAKRISKLVDELENPRG
jgi:hypothetical protein